MGSFDCRLYTTVVETEVCVPHADGKMYILLDDEAVLWGLYSFHINSELDWDCLQSFVPKADQNMTQLNLVLEYVAADSEAANLLPKWV